MNNHFLKPLLATALAVVTTASAWAHPTHAHVDVHDPWVRATVAQQKATGAFMRLVAQEDRKLVEARSPVAGVVEVHEMVLEQDVMKMRALKGGLPLQAGKPVELRPGSYHIMLMDLKAPVKAGDVVPVTLVFEDPQGQHETLDIQAPVRALGSGAAPAAGHHYGGHGGRAH